MKIAIDISPLQSGHKVRGVGFYLEYLKRSLLEYFPENDYVFFNNSNELGKDIDLVHYPYFDPFFLTLPLKQKYKTVVTVHDLTPLVFPEHFPAGLKGNLKWQLQKLNLKKVNAIISDSVASKNDIIKIAGIPEEKVSVAYLAAGKEFHTLEKTAIDHNLKKKYKLPEKFVLYVGDITWNKNVPRLVKAMKQVDLPLVMVGKSLVNNDFDKTNPWNNDLVEVQSLVENDKNITMLGFVPTEDLVALYNLATVFVFPSLYEGFGLPIIEAMQSGCPVVTTTNGSLKEIVGDAAQIVNGYEVDEIMKGITKVFTSDALQKELSAKGLQQAKKFSWKKTAEATVEVYQKVLHQR
jgi:glycosyltransferase involved in cell wall biosynthesis